MTPAPEPITDDRARQFYVHAYAWDMGNTPSIGQERAREIQAREWDAWLTAHDARVRAEALREAADRMRGQDAQRPLRVIASVLDRKADQIEQEATR